MGSIGTTYLSIGLIIFAVQSYSGQLCDPFSGERWAVRREYPSAAVIMWLPDLVKHVWSEDMTLREYFAPTRCTSK